MIRRATKYVILLTLFALSAMVFAGCGEAKPKSTKTPAKLEQVRGTIITPSSSADVIDIKEHAGGVRSLLMDGPLKNDAEVRSMAASKEPVVAFFRGEDRGDVLVRIERAPKAASDVPQVTGLITAVNAKGQMTVKTSDGAFEFVVPAEEVEFFDYEHLSEHKSTKQPVTIYYETSEQDDARTGLIYIGFDDA